MVECNIVDLAFINMNSKNTASEIVEFLNNPGSINELKERFLKQIKNYEE